MSKMQNSPIGDAVLVEGTIGNWQYTTTVLNPDLAGTRISFSPRDKARNVTVMNFES